MKKKKLFLGVFTTALIFTSTLVLQAKTESINIPVKYNNIKINVDGKQISTSNEPFIYNGVTYLPVRDVAAATGKTVNWDENTKTVSLTSQGNAVNNNQSTQPKTITLSNGSYIVGKDLPAGKYDIKCTRGIGSVHTDDYDVSIMLVSPEMLEEYKRMGTDIFYSEYKNAILKEGKSLNVDDITIELIPVS